MTSRDAGVRPRTLQARLVTLALAALGAGALVTAAVAAVAVLRLVRQVNEDGARLVALADAQIGRVITRDLEALQTLASNLSASGRSDPGMAVRQAYLEVRSFDVVFLAEGTRVIAQEPRDVSIAATVLSRPAGANAVTLGQDCPMPERCLTYVMLGATDGATGRAQTVGGVLDPASHRIAPLLRSLQQSLGDRASIVDARGRPPILLPISSPGSVPESRSQAMPWHAVASPARGCCSGLLDTRPQQAALALAGVVSAVLLAIAWGAARSISRPVEALTRAAERMAAGDMDVVLPDPTKDEVGRLAAGFDRMRVSLKSALTEIESANRDLEGRVRERTAELERLYGELQMRDRGRARLLRQVISAQEDERKRIARDLHDDTCQMLGAIAMHVGALEKVPSRDAFAEVKQLVQRATEGVRRQIYDLRPSALDDLGLVDAVRAHATRHLERIGVDVRFEADAEKVPLAREVETAVFRAVQELITNIERHANASHVVIQITTAAGRLAIDLEDDGRGFDLARTAQHATAGGGVGLIGVQERVALAGGTIRIDSAPGQGTHTHIQIPIETASGGVEGAATSAE
jgi:signal transduction histidine kinase